MQNTHGQLRDPDGDKDEKKFKITINAAPVPVAFPATTSIEDQTFEVGTLKELILPPAQSGTGTGDLTYSLTPALPAGLAFASATRILGGTATAAAVATTYTYKVTDSAVDDDGDAAPTEAELMFDITVVDPATQMPPGMPTAVTATADQDADTVTISWTAPADDGGSAITGYTITQTGQAPGSYTAAADATSHTTGALAAGTYSFTVKATNAIGDSAESSAAPATINPDEVPVALTTTIDDQTYTAGTAITDLVLPAADANTGTGDLTYSLTPAIGNGLTFTAATRTISGTPTAAAAAVEYTYTVTDSATPATSAEQKFTITVDAAPLAQPTSVAVAPAYTNGLLTGYTVTWSVANTTGINGYYVQYEHNPTVTEYVQGASNRRLTITNTPTSLSVWSTEDSSDQSPTAPPTGVVPGAADPTVLANLPALPTVPGAPRIVSAVQVEFTKNVNITFETPADNGGSVITHYVIQWTGQASGEDLLRVSPFSPNQRVAHTVTVPHPGDYTFKIAAQNAIGNSDFSNEISATVDAPSPAPGIPVGLEAVDAGSAQVLLTWTPPTHVGGAAVTGQYAEATIPGYSQNWIRFPANRAEYLDRAANSVTLPMADDVRFRQAFHNYRLRKLTFRIIAVNDAGRLSDPSDVAEVILERNYAPTVTITTETPQEAQMGSFDVAYTTADRNKDTVTVRHLLSVDPVSAARYYSVATAAEGKMFTITQMTPSAANPTIPLAKVTLTLTPNDGFVNGVAKSIGVFFKEAVYTPVVDNDPPTVKISFEPVDPYSVTPVQRNLLDVILNFNEPIDVASLKDKLGRAGIDPIEQIEDGELYPPIANRYKVRVRVVDGHAAGKHPAEVKVTDVILKRGVTDIAGNPIVEDKHARYKPTRPMPVITASDSAIDCRGGMHATTITVTFTHKDPVNAVYKIKAIDEGNPAGGALVEGDITLSNPGFSTPGWRKVPGSFSYNATTDTATFKVERIDTEARDFGLDKRHCALR